MTLVEWVLLIVAIALLAAIGFTLWLQPSREMKREMFRRKWATRDPIFDWHDYESSCELEHEVIMERMDEVAKEQIGAKLQEITASLNRFTALMVARKGAIKPPEQRLH